MFVILAHNWWMLLLRGILGWIGTYAIFFGMAFTALALRLRRWVARQTE